MSNHPRTLCARRRVFGMLAAGVASIGLLLAGPTHAMDVKERTLRLSFVNVKEHPHGIGVERFAELVKQKSQGKLKVALYPGGTLGGDLQVVSSMQGGTIDMSVMVPGSLVGLNKEFGVFDLPFLFKDAREADAVLDGPFGRKLLARLPEKGLVGLSFWDHGFRNVTTNKKPIVAAEDFQGLKLRVQQIPIYIDMMKALGANAVPLPFPELYPALESGTVDGQENPLTSIVGSKLHEAQKFLSITRHTYNPLLVLASKKTWEKLSEDERNILVDAANEAKPYQRSASRDAEAKALDVIRAAGLKINEVSPAEIERMREKVRPAADKFSKDAGEAVVQELRAEVAKARAAALQASVTK